MRKIRRLVQVFLIAVFAVCLVNFIVKKIDIAATEAEIEQVETEKREKELRNGELEDILTEENKAVRIRQEDVAEKFAACSEIEKQTALSIIDAYLRSVAK